MNHPLIRRELQLLQKTKSCQTYITEWSTAYYINASKFIKPSKCVWTSTFLQTLLIRWIDMHWQVARNYFSLNACSHNQRKHTFALVCILSATASQPVCCSLFNSSSACEHVASLLPSSPQTLWCPRIKENKWSLLPFPEMWFSTSPCPACLVETLSCM